MNKSCIICDNSSFKNTAWGGYHFEKQIYDIIRCSKCGFMFLNPFPDKNILNDIYDGDDFFENYYATSQGVISYTDGMADCKDKIRNVIKLIKKHKKSGKLLDIGCAAGMFLAEARGMGYEISGIEPSCNMVKCARDNFGLDITCGNIKDIAHSSNRFDIIHTGDVLEHMPELREDIKVIKRLLTDNGIFVIEQPLMYNKSLFNLILKLKMVISRNKYSANIPAHLWEFNAVTLRKFLEVNNFKIIYYKIFESAAKPLAIYNKPGMKNIAGYYIKWISCFISNNILFRRLLLGDRAIVICEKKINQKL